MAKRRLMKLPIMTAVVLGPLTGELISLASAKLPYSERKVFVIDLLSSPGGIVSGLFYPEGISSGSMGFAYIAVAVNWLFYAACWYLIIRLIIAIVRHIFHLPSNGSPIHA